MVTTWLTICNATKANIYDISKTKKKLNGFSSSLLVKVLEHPEGRMKGIDLTTDKAGKYKARNFGRGKFSAQTTPHEGELEHFAKEIGVFLDNQHAKQHFQSLVVCADPHFQGVLEKHLSSKVKQSIHRYIPKNYLPLEGDKSKKHKLDKAVYAIQYSWRAA